MSFGSGLFALTYNISAMTVTTTGARVLMLDGFMHQIGTCMPSFALGHSKLRYNVVTFSDRREKG